MSSYDTWKLATPPEHEGPTEEPEEEECPVCKGSGIEEVYGGHGTVHEEPCSYCGGLIPEPDCEHVSSASLLDGGAK